MDIIGFTGKIFEYTIGKGLPRWLRRQRICLQCRRPRFNPWVRKIPSRREWLPTPVFLAREFHGQSNLVDYSPWSSKGSDTAKLLTVSQNRMQSAGVGGRDFEIRIRSFFNKWLMLRISHSSKSMWMSHVTFLCHLRIPSSKFLI